MARSGRISAVIVAAGSGERVGGEVPKQFLGLGGRPVLAWAVRAFREHPLIDRVVVVLAPRRVADPPAWLDGGVRVVAGGASRAASVRAGLAAVDGSAVLVHDGVRPFVSAALIGRVAAAAAEGPVVPAVPVADTIKRVDGEGRVVETPPRSMLRAVQTPQGFPTELLRRAHEASAPGGDPTDDAEVCEALGGAVRTVEGELINFKITTEADLLRARHLIEAGLISWPYSGSGG